MQSLTQIEGKAGILSYGLYQMFREKFKGVDRHSSEANVYFATWQRICKKFNQRKMQSIISGHIFHMPFRLGSIGIVQFKKKLRFNKNGKLITKGLIVDWKKTMAMWRDEYGNLTRQEFAQINGKKVVYMTNEHTDGRIFRFHWKKKFAVVRNISAYKLIVPNQHKRALHALVMNKPNVQYCTKF